jgi:hypothetical protein
MNRRHFLKHAAGAVAATTAGVNFASNLQAAAPTLAKNEKKIVMIYLNGGASMWDLLDIGFGKMAGNWQPIETSVPGIRVSELMPETAKLAKHLTFVRNYSSREGDHNRGMEVNTKNRFDNPITNFPGFGSIVAHYSKSNASLPPLFSLNGTTPFTRASFLGARYAGFPATGGQIPENIGMANLGVDPATAKTRYARREGLFKVLENNFNVSLFPTLTKESERKATNSPGVLHSDVYGQAFDTLKMGDKTFLYTPEDTAKLNSTFGNTGFGRGCLTMTKLLQAGAVGGEVSLGGFDMHGGIDRAMPPRAAELDKGFAGLIKTLVDTGLIENTVVMMMTDFARTPMNMNGGRDHWGNNYSVVSAGGGLKGGISFGKNTADDIRSDGEPVRPEPYFATILEALHPGLLANRNEDMHGPNGNRIYPVGEKEPAKPIKELLAKG